MKKENFRSVYLIHKSNKKKQDVGADVSVCPSRKTDNKNKGITLIALVITIIVLLILAGVSLKLIAGGDGIIGKAEKAVNTYTEAAVLEKINLKMLEYISDKAENPAVTVRKYLEEIEGCIGVVEDDSEDNPEGYIATIEKYAFKVSANGEVLEKVERTTSPEIKITQNGKDIEVSMIEKGEIITVLEILDSAENVLTTVAKEDMTQNEKGYVFNYSFEKDGTYIVKVTTRRRKRIPKRGYD